jgi:hypothetical protein
VPGAGFAPPPAEEEVSAPSESGLLDEEAMLDAEAAAEAAREIVGPVELGDSPPANDDPLASFDVTQQPSMKLAESGGEPIALARFYGSILNACADTTTMLARHRFQRAMCHQARSETRLLASVDAILATGKDCIDALSAWWKRSLESTDPWKTWAPVFALGSIEGFESIRAMLHGIEMLPADARAHGVVAAEALAVAPHSEKKYLGATLLASSSPTARAIGVDVCARCGDFTDEDLARHLGDPVASVVAAALLAAERLVPTPTALIRPILMKTLDPDAEVAFRAARLLSIWGLAEPCDEVREREGLLSLIRSRALELFVLHGRAGDLPRMEEIMRRSPITPAVLSAIGRFGHPASWSFLTHFLDDENLAEAANTALVTMFGPIVPRKEWNRRATWKRAIAAASLDASTRYRRGMPWSVKTVLLELRSGELARAEAQLRIDELRARTRVMTVADLCLWAPDVEVQLVKLDAMAVTADKQRTGEWA